MKKVIMKREGRLISFSKIKGDNYNIMDKYDDKTVKVCGWKTVYDGSFEDNIQVGDVLKLNGSQNKIGFFIVLENETTSNPKDMFFAKLYNVASCDETVVNSVTYKDIYDFALTESPSYIKYFNLNGELEVNVKIVGNNDKRAFIGEE